MSSTEVRGCDLGSKVGGGNPPLFGSAARYLALLCILSRASLCRGLHGGSGSAQRSCATKNRGLERLSMHSHEVSEGSVGCSVGEGASTGLCLLPKMASCLSITSSRLSVRCSKRLWLSGLSSLSSLRKSVLDIEASADAVFKESISFIVLGVFRAKAPAGQRAAVWATEYLMRRRSSVFDANSE